MEQTVWSDFLAKQAPVVAVLGIFCYIMGRFFIAQLKQKDDIITAKDDKLEKNHQSLTELYGKAIEAQNRGNMVQEQLLEVIKETKEDVNRLSDKLR